VFALAGSPDSKVKKLMKKVVLRAHPQGNPRVDDFALEATDKPTAASGELLLKTLWLSLDPLIRFALDEVVITGRTRVKIGDVIYGSTVSQVVESNHPDYAAGDIVQGRTGWAEYAAINPAEVPLQKVDSDLAPVSTALGVLGMPGQTAHTAMLDVARVKDGETVVISAAAGVVGSTAGQIGKILGARVVGIAGGKDKCEALLEMGFDACVDYKADDFGRQLADACPEGIDVYLDNVGGDVTLTVMPLLNYGARMPLCGYIAYYGMGMEGPGPDHLPGFMRMIMSKGLEIKGFGGILAGPGYLEDMVRWLKEGLIKSPETVVEGIENAAEAFVSIFQDNKNIGKLLVHIADPD